MKELSAYLTEELQTNNPNESDMERPTSTYYDAAEIPAGTLEEIIKGIHKRGFGAAGPAITSSAMYHWIAEEYARQIGAKWPHLSYLKCTYEHHDRRSVYGVPHCDVVDKILYKYFNTYAHGDEDYWYKKSTTLKSVLRWLGDDMRGTMENPY